MHMKRQTNRIYITVIGLSFVVGFLGVWILPNCISNLIKPFVILVVVACFFGCGRIRCDKYGVLYILLVSVITISTCINGTFGTIDYISFIINIIYGLAISQANCKEGDYETMCRYVKYASIILSIVVMISNPLIGTISSPTINLFVFQVNKNSVPYLIAPGTFVCVLEFVSFKYYNCLKRARLVVEVLILLYGGIYPMSRGGFVCIFMPIIVFLISQLLHKKISLTKITYLLLALVAFLIVLPCVLPEQYVDRLLRINSYTYTNDRFDYMIIALESVKGNELFGGGFGRFQAYTGMPYGSHNSFADVFVISGFFGLILFIIMFVYPVLKARNVETTCWVIMALSAAFFESQISYQIWVPLALGWISYKKLKYEDCHGIGFNHSSCV